MISRRVILNLAAFFLLFLGLCLWAVRNVIRFDFIERPYRIVAEFDTSPGLRPDFEVTYLGVRVGAIDSVSLRGDRVRVVLGIERGRDLPAGLSAAVKRKSAVGEPYVDLVPPAGYEGGRPFIEAGDEIPLERTSTPLSYSELFGSLDRLVAAVPGDDLAILVHELAVALDGRGPSIRRLLESTDDLTATLATRTDLLDQLTTDLTRLTHTLSTHREALGSSFDNLALLTETLAASRAQVAALLDEAPSFGEEVASLLAATEGDLGCTLDGLASVVAVLADPVNLDHVAQLLERVGPVRDLLLESVVPTGVDGADGPYLDNLFEFNTGAVPVPVYDPKPTLPPPSRVAGCAEVGAPATDAGPGGDASGRGEGVDAGATPSPADVSDRTGVPPRRFPASSERDADKRLIDISAGQLLRLLLVAAVVAGIVAWRRWRAARI